MAPDTLSGQRSRDTSSTEAVADVTDPFWMWRQLEEPVVTPTARSAGGGAVRPVRAHPVPSVTTDDLRHLADLDDPRLVLTEAYVGLDRRRPGLRGSLARGVHGSRRSLLRIDFLITLVVLLVVVAAGLAFATRPLEATHRPAAALPTDPPTATAAAHPHIHSVVAPAVSPRAVAPAASPTPVSTPPATAPTAVPVAATPAPDPSSPDAMGAAALALVRFPWQEIPGYSIRFLPIADAPSPGFYGNTDFTWGQTGGVSTLYVFPGESVDQLAGITAFEIGHEVDAAFVEPQGGHDQIADILDVHPASWAPECDCAEQGYLSGWYAAAFSDYWSPGVGAWSTLAPPPTGAVLDAVRPWLDPSVT